MKTITVTCDSCGRALSGKYVKTKLPYTDGVDISSMELHMCHDCMMHVCEAVVLRINSERARCGLKSLFNSDGWR